MTCVGEREMDNGNQSYFRCIEFETSLVIIPVEMSNRQLDVQD